MGRAHHLKETLPKNIADNAGFPDLEFVIVDYNSKDGLEDWARVALKDHIASGRVVYLAERSAQWFDKCHAKNIAHCAASGDVLVNIDADNFTGEGYAAKLAEIFLKFQNPVVANQLELNDMYGKIAMRREFFYKLRGYDERMIGYGFEDVDITRRAVKMGAHKIRMAWPGERAITHTDEERSKNFRDGEHTKIGNSRNTTISKSRAPDVAVNPLGFGLADVFVNFSKAPTRIGAA
jgi:hypothetical protein